MSNHPISSSNGSTIVAASRDAWRAPAMPVTSKDHEAQLRNLIAGYGDSIRLSDIKANIAVLFVAIMMGTVLQFRDHYPHYLNVPVLLAPFIVIFFNLLASVYPRFPRAGRRRFPIWRSSNPDDFEFIADPVLDVEELPVRCALHVANSVLEEHNPSDRLSRRDGDARRRRGAVVRELARMIAASRRPIALNVKTRRRPLQSHDVVHA